MQLAKLAAAARIASACMSGWPDEPDSPLQSSLLTGAGGAGGPPNRRKPPMLPVKRPPDSGWASRDWADAGPTELSSTPDKSAAAAMRRYRLPPAMLANPSSAIIGATSHPRQLGTRCGYSMFNTRPDG